MDERLLERNAAIRGARTPAELKTQAERFSISLSHAYRLRKTAEHARVSAGTSADRFQADMTRGLLFSEMATYGLKRSGGMIDEDYDRTFKPLSKKVKVLREMGDDPIVAAVLQAIKMLIRRVSWYVQPAGSGRADRAAADFLETCMKDMSHSWMDSIDQALAMLQYGFSVAEIVYKKRQGEKPEAASTYDDGRIGWRKWLYIAPYSLAPGEPWSFDEHGGIQTINQLDFYTTPNATQVNIPIDKALLFRTTAENNNPEGRSVLRAMYWPYYIKRNLEEIEAISAERLGAGLPVVYAGQDVAKGPDPNTDFELLKNIVRNVRVDEQMGVAIPFAKMGAGAREGEGVLFELITPSGGKAVDFNQVIARYEQRMAMVGLAQFIHLGMNAVGARALGESSQDFFTLSVSGWADLIEETIHRYATERLMRLNFFPGITAYPRIVHESIVRKSLAEVADYINKLVGSMVITPDSDLEKYLRELAELPEKKEMPVVKTPAHPGEAPGAEGEQPSADVAQQVQAVASEVEPALNLNGAQIKAVMDIVSSVTRGEITREAGLNMLKIMFGMSQGQAQRILGGIEDKIKSGAVQPAAPNPEQSATPPDEKASESFAIRGGGRSGRRPSQIDAVNAYQAELQGTYDAWADDLSNDLAEEEDDDKRQELIAAALALLLASLIALSRKRLVEAFTRGLGGEPASPELLDDLSKALKENEMYLVSSLLPAIGAKLRSGLMDGDIIAALQQSNEIGAQAIKAMLDTMKARTGSYSGNWWAIYNHTIGKNAPGKVAWYLDSQAKHCHDCPRFGTVNGTVYDSYQAMLEATGGREPARGVECGANCRCEVRPVG